MSLRHPKGEKTQNPPRLCRSDCAQSCPCSDGKRAEGCPEVAELHRHPLGYDQNLLCSCSTSDQDPSTIPSMDWVSAAAFASMLAPVSLCVMSCVWSQLLLLRIQEVLCSAVPKAVQTTLLGFSIRAL